MADAIPLRAGQVNQAGDVRANFLKVFAGEVLSAFDLANVFKEKHMVRQIASGKTAQFPMTSRVNAAYHAPGSEILGQNSNLAEETISIDDMLVADVFFPEIDMAMSHFEYRTEYTRQTGLKLANVYDANVCTTLIQAARAANRVTGEPGGTSLVNAGYDNDGLIIAAGMYDAAQAMDEKNCEGNDRQVAFAPRQYYLVAQAKDYIDKDYGGMGSVATGQVVQIAGISIFKSNNTKFGTDRAGETGPVTPAKYQEDLTNTRGIVFQRGAAGTVELVGLMVRSQDDLRRLGTLVVSNMAVGHGRLRPECAVELATA